MEPFGPWCPLWVTGCSRRQLGGIATRPVVPPPDRRSADVEPQNQRRCTTGRHVVGEVVQRRLAVVVCFLLLGAGCGGGDAARAPSSGAASSTRNPPAEFSFEEAADLLAQREIFVTPISADQQARLLDLNAFEAVLDDWMSHHPHWKVLSVHLGELDLQNAHFDISNRPSYFVEITGPETGNCFYLFDAADGEEFLGACFYPIHTGSLTSPVKGSV
jgi:hypothetical protein